MYIQFPEADISTGASSFELVRQGQEAELIKYRRFEKRPEESAMGMGMSWGKYPHRGDSKWKGTYIITTASTILNGERVDALPQDPEQSKTFPLTPSIQLYTESHSQTRQEKEMNGVRLERKIKKGSH